MKTYWHLLSQQRKPSEYEIATSKLLAYRDLGLEVDVPLKSWYRTNQSESPFACASWDRFRDPRETTYSSYTTLQRDRETYVNTLMESARNADFSEEWLGVLERLFAPFRYPGHAFQMIAAYIGSMAPSSRIAIAALFQAADEMRRVHRIAYRTRQLQLDHPGFAADSKTVWERDPIWQPLREAVERLLVAYDWGEAFVGLNLVLKPHLDRLWLVEFGKLARKNGDEKLQDLFLSLYEDCRWHEAWSDSLLRLVLEENPGVQGAVSEWIARWHPRAQAAVAAFAPLLDGVCDKTCSPKEVVREA